uniref:Uncharacterized protein n=1 Tax=Anguilla anguilla TaxID=7936 RepID=A0A0E9Y0A4_ANGAN
MVSHGGSFDLLGTLTDFSEELLDVITVNQKNENAASVFPAYLFYLLFFKTPFYIMFQSTFENKTVNRSS